MPAFTPKLKAKAKPAPIREWHDSGNEQGWQALRDLLLTIHNPSGAINSSGYFSNKIPCPIHGGEDKNAAVSAISGGIFCHSHCGKVTSVDVAEHYDIDWKTIVYGERDARVKRFRTAHLDTAPSQPETMEAWVRRTFIPRLPNARVTQHEAVWDAASDDEWNKHPLIIT